MAKEEEVIKITYPFEMVKTRWKIFKSFIPRTITNINDKIVELIENFIELSENGGNIKQVSLTDEEWKKMFTVCKTESPSKAVKNLIERLL